MESVLLSPRKTYNEENQMLFQAVKDVQNGDRQAFEQVYKLSERYIYSIISKIVHDDDKTADLMQETYLQIYNKLHTLQNVESFLIWAGRIATNKTLRFIQKYNKEVLAKEEDYDFIFEKASDDKEEFLPEDIMLNKEKKSKIHDILNNLSNEQKITVQYYYLGDMSVSEIAEVMQCSTGTVKSRLNYARKNIKAAVLETEKREGIKLYSLSGLPLFALLFHEQVEAVTVPSEISSLVLKGISEIAGLKIAEAAGMEIAEVGKKGIRKIINKFFKTTSGKVASGVAIATVAGTVALTQLPKTLYVTPNSIFESSHLLYYNEFYSHWWVDKKNHYVFDEQYVFFQNDSGQVGLYTINGEEVLPYEFDKIRYEDYTGGLYKVEKNNKVTYYSKSGKMICDSMCDNVSDVIDGMFWCYHKDSNRYKVYSVDGRQISTSTFDGIGEMANGLVTVKREGKWSVFRKDGNQIVDFIDAEVYLGDGEFISINERFEKGTRLSVLDNKGNIVYTENSTNGLYFKSGFYNGVAHLSGYIDSMMPSDIPVKADGTILNNLKGIENSEINSYNNFKLYPNGYFSYKNNELGKTVLFDTDGNQIAIASYSGFTYLFNRFIISDNGKHSLINEQGDVILSEYDDIKFRYNGNYYICLDHNGYDLYNKEGIILFNDASEIWGIGCEMFECGSENETFIVNGQNGKKFVLSPEEHIVSVYSDGYAIKLTRNLELSGGKPAFNYEVVDKTGKTEYTIETSKDSFIDQVMVLKKGVYSYRDKDKCYIKTW